MPDVIGSEDLGSGLHLMTLQLHLDPLFLKVCERKVPIDLVLLCVERVDDHVYEEVSDEQ